jgi:hypothetical protein
LLISSVLGQKRKLPRKPKKIHALGAVLVSRPYFNSIPGHYIRPNNIQGLTSNTAFQVPAPPPGDQQTEGSCVAWSVGYTFFSSYLQRHRPAVWDSTTEISPGFIYHFIKINGDCINAGSNVPWALTAIANIGACTMKSWPYVINDCNILPTKDQLVEAAIFRSPCGDPNATNDPPVQQAGRGKCDIGDNPLWVTIPQNSVADYKAFLKQFNWPIIVAFNVNTSFDQMWATNGIWTTNNGKVRGGHSVCVVGWDDSKTYNGKTGMFKCQNQWGTDGGDKGYFWVTYELVSSGCFPEAYGWVRDETAHPPMPFHGPYPPGPHHKEP